MWSNVSCVREQHDGMDQALNHQIVNIPSCLTLQKPELGSPDGDFTYSLHVPYLLHNICVLPLPTCS